MFHVASASPCKLSRAWKIPHFTQEVTYEIAPPWPSFLDGKTKVQRVQATYRSLVALKTTACLWRPCSYSWFCTASSYQRWLTPQRKNWFFLIRTSQWFLWSRRQISLGSFPTASPGGGSRTSKRCGPRWSQQPGAGSVLPMLRYLPQVPMDSCGHHPCPHIHHVPSEI